MTTAPAAQSPPPSPRRPVPAAQSPLSGITALDLTEPSDLDVFTALLERSDVLISGRVPALGEDTEAIRAEVGEPG